MDMKEVRWAETTVWMHEDREVLTGTVEWRVHSHQTDRAQDV